MKQHSQNNPLPIVVLISGKGTNLQAITDATQSWLPAKICAVISDRSNAYGLVRAKKANIATKVLLAKDYKDRTDYDQALHKIIDHYRPELIVLAGFMRILSDDLVKHYRGQMINIHPSLLPKYPGLNTHERVIAAGDKEHGVTVHFVTEELDSGPIIARWSIPITAKDTPETLESKIHSLEHKIYPEVIAWFAAGKLRLRGDSVILNKQLLSATGFKFNEQAYQSNYGGSHKEAEKNHG